MADYSDYKECTDCVHYELCLHQEKFLIEHNRKDLIRRYGFGLSEPEICCNFRDRSRFVELPDDFPKYRLTTDVPKENYSDLLNYVYAKDGNILLRYANGKESMDLCDYIAFHAKDCLVDSQDVLDGACLECDDDYCSLGRAYIASVQAAKLRERLKLYEDLTEQALKN